MTENPQKMTEEELGKIKEIMQKLSEDYDDTMILLNKTVLAQDCQKLLSHIAALEAELKEPKCEHCFGIGRVIMKDVQCPWCHGSGKEES